MVRHKGDYHVSRAYVLGWLVVVLHHICVIVAGIVGLTGAPSPAVIAVVGGSIATYLWSGVFIAFGTFALLARLTRRVRAEAVAVLSIAAARLLWSGIIFYTVDNDTSPAGSSQVAWLMVAGALFLVGWSLTVLTWLSGAPIVDRRTNSILVVTELRDHLQTAIDADDEGDDS